MKVLKYFAVSALALTLFASCKKNEPNKENGPKDLVVSLTLGSAPRAAIGDATDKIADQAAASVKAVDMYLVDDANMIVESKRFTGAELTKLMEGSALAKPDDRGFKFVDVAASVTKVVTIVNPQADAKNAGERLSFADLSLKVAANEAVYYNVATLASATEVENYGPAPHTDAGRRVIAMNIKAEGLMNRFQVEDVDFVAIKFKDANAKSTYGAALNAFVSAKMAADPALTREAAIALWKTDASGMNGSSYANPDAPTGFDPSKKWADFFNVINVSKDNTGLFMNRFNDEYALSLDVNKLGMMKTLLSIAKEKEGYTPASGALVFGAKDRASIASYYVAGGLMSVLTVNAADPSKNKVAAFNFFANDNNTVKLNYAKDGTAPSLHFYFGGSDVSDAKRYVNIKGYLQEGAGTVALDNANMAKGAQLLTINIRKAGDVDGDGNNPDGDGDGKPDGPVVDSDDPTVPDNGNPDITDDGKKNLAVHVTVTPWTNNNVKPVF